MDAAMEANQQVSAGKYATDISSIREAQVRINPFIHRTPIFSSETLSSIAGRKLLVTCECFQKGGNHGAALSLATKLRRIPAYIVVPKNAPKCKVENVKRHGGQVIWSEPNMKSREEMASKVVQETGAILLHSYNYGGIISRQGTISLELLKQAPEIDTIIVPISGGVALAAKAINPTIRILAAKPKGANDAALSKASGRIITLPQTDTIADGLQAFLGDLTWQARHTGEEVLEVKGWQLPPLTF